MIVELMRGNEMLETCSCCRSFAKYKFVSDKSTMYSYRNTDCYVEVTQTMKEEEDGRD